MSRPAQLSERSAAQLTKAAWHENARTRRLTGRPNAQPGLGPVTALAGGGGIIVKPQGTIAARNGAQLSSGVCDIQTKNQTDALENDGTRTADVWNLLNDDMTTDGYYHCHKIGADYYCTHYVFEFFDCPEPPPETVSPPI